ncbi:MAG: universal stress protein [Flavobacteriales bacterium]
MKRILLLTDFSENAKNAIRYGINLFGNSAEYILLHAYTVRKATGSFGNIGQILRQDAENNLKTELDFIKNEFPDPSLNILTLCREGDPVGLINGMNNKQGIELIIMGTKGASGLSKAILGSVASSVIQDTNYPVLSIPEEAVYESINRIVFAADLSANVEDELTKPLIEIADRSKSEIFLLHILKEGKLAEGSIDDKLEKLELPPNFNHLKKSVHFIEANDTVNGIKAFCAEKNADLLTVVARHHSFFEKLLHKSVSQELAFSSKMPLLSLEDALH